ncbi:outer membrane lipoprotein carrier protein LolA, partial [Draconibacterium sp.]|nr:outer membrane lipoprotein carrier protein LolA [Draconibacterium sp.]
MRKVYLIGMILLASVIAMAQQDEKAKEILNKASEKNRSYKSMAADFVFSMKNVEMEIDEKNQGSIKIKGQKYCVELPDVGMKMISDGTTLWNYMKDGNQVTISNLEDTGNDLMDPSSLFTIYEQGFKSKFVEEKKVGS